MTNNQYVRSQGNKRSPVFLYIVYIVYMLYYIADMNTSANIVVKQTMDRGSVHIYLFILIVILGAFFITRRFFSFDDGFSNAFLALIVWSALIDIVRQTSFWSVATHVGLLVLFYFSYFFASEYVDTKEKFNRIVGLEIILWIITMIYGVIAYLNFGEYYGNYSSSVLNMSYNILVFVPVLLLIRNKSIRFATVAVSLVYVLISLKRGAIIAAIIMLATYFMTDNNNNEIENSNRNEKPAKRLVYMGMFILAALIINHLADGALFGRFTVEELTFGSTRNVIYRTALQEIRTRSIDRLLFGTGSGSTTLFIGSGAHNELLELTISYGIIGMVLYLVLLLSGIRNASRLKTLGISTKNASIYLMSLMYILSVGIYGSSLFSHMTFHIMLTMGLMTVDFSTFERGINEEI